MSKFKTIMAAMAVTAGITSGLMISNSTEAAAKTTVRSYQNIKNATYTIKNKKAVVYTTAKLNHKKSAKLGQYGSKVTGYYAAHVTKNGKKAIYYKFKSANGSTGWIWHGWLKKTVTNSNSNLPTNWYDGNDNSQTTTTKTPTAPKTPTKSQHQFSLTEYRQAFLTKLNQERTSRGLNPVAEDTKLNQLADIRATELKTNYSHYDANGNSLAKIHAIELNINYWNAECNNMSTEFNSSNSDSTHIADGQTSADLADNDVWTFIYSDESANWGHRDILLNKNKTLVGISANYAVNNGSVSQYCAIELSSK